MRTGQDRFGGERGMVLFSSLLILSLLMAVGVGARVMLQSDYKIVANLRGSTEAFYLADAGIEWGKDEVARTMTHPPNPAGRAQSFSSGTFIVSFLPPVEVTPLVAKVVIRSTGAVRTSSQTIQAQVTKTYDLADAAVGLRGSANRVGFSGNSFFVSGLDHDPASGEVISGSKPRPAISVSDDALKKLVDAGLGPVQASNSLESGTGASPIIQSDFLPAQAITRLANELCSSADAQITVIPSEGVLSLEGQTWGSRTSPQLRCIAGLPATGDSINLGGNFSGAGILVVRDAELVANGAFRWEGLVIVTGNNVGFREAGTESKEIYGSLIVSETGNPGTGLSILDIQGALRLLFSRSALSRAAGLIPSLMVENNYNWLPFTVTQNYWQTVTP